MPADDRGVPPVPEWAAGWRDEIVIALLCADDFDNGGEVWLPNNTATLRLVREGAKHDGDCTKQSYTCLRCLVEDAEKRADVLIRVLALQRPDPIAAARREAIRECTRAITIQIAITSGVLIDNPCREQVCRALANANKKLRTLADKPQQPERAANERLAADINISAR